MQSEMYVERAGEKGKSLWPRLAKANRPLIWAIRRTVVVRCQSPRKSWWIIHLEDATQDLET